MNPVELEVLEPDADWPEEASEAEDSEEVNDTATTEAIVADVDALRFVLVA